MRVSVIGSGYVGLVTGTCLAEHGHRVNCVDKIESRIELLRQGVVPIYEPGLKELIDRNVRGGRLTFTTDAHGAVKASEVVIIAVGTPPGPEGAADLKDVTAVAESLGQAMNGYKVIVNKSTVPVGTADRVAAIIREYGAHDFDVVSNPEFLREGAAVEDCMHPDRIVIGTGSERAAALMRELYHSFEAPIVLTDTRSAELIKYASNAFLAVKISFINEVAGLCERLGADVLEVARGMGHDHRIGAAFLKAGIGYGGSCFPKDTQALVYMAKASQMSLPIIESAMAVNHLQRSQMVERMKRTMGSLNGKIIAVLGVAFKPNTDDVREAPALDVMAELVRAGASVRAYDPKATDTARAVLPAELLAQITFADSAESAIGGAHAVVLATEWPEFATLRWDNLYADMASPYIFDGRNFLSAHEMRKLGFKYIGIGRPAVAQPKADMRDRT